MSTSGNNDRKAPLHVGISDGKLVISIGVKTLAFAAVSGPWFDNWFLPFINDGPAITDVDLFAKEILSELRRESEDGTTLVHLMLDRAAQNAVENGVGGIQLPKDSRIE